MPKKKVISMLEFLRTGMFGGLSVGADVADLRPHFGEPVYIKNYRDLTAKWAYEDMEFYVNLELQKVYGIIIAGFQDKDDLGHYPRENKDFKIDPWILRWESGLLNTKNALDSVNLEFLQIPNAPSEGYETFRLKSGTQIIFAEEPDWVDGIQVWTENPRIVIDAIINTSSELAETSSDFQYS
jgi:hypothetical protein